MLKAEWQATECARETKYYRVIAAGRKQLEQERADWNRLCEAIALVLGAAE